MLHSKIRHANGVGIKGIRFDDVCASKQIFSMNLFDHIWTNQHQRFVVVFKVYRVLSKTIATIVLLFKMMPLNHGAHGSIYNQYSIIEELSYGMRGEQRGSHFQYLFIVTSAVAQYVQVL